MKKKKRLDWVSLKKEFMLGNYATVTEFRQKKGLPEWTKSRTSGWMGEKKRLTDKTIELSAKQVAKKELEDLSEIRLKQARIARFMQLKGISYLKSEDVHFKSADEARKMISTGLSQERSALNMNNQPNQKGDTNLTQINIGGKTNMDKLLETLDYEGIIGLIAEIKRERDRRSLSDSADKGEGEIQDGEII